MKPKNELFLEAVDFLIDEGLASDSSDVAQKAGLGPNLISRVRTGKVKSVSDDSIRALAARFNLNMDFFRGKSEYITRYDMTAAIADQHIEEAQRFLGKSISPKVSEPLLPALPDYVQKLIEESIRMSTRNELLERQCEKLIAELREAKENNNTFIEELKKSKEFNDTLAAELKISREQNETLITQLRETRKELQTAIDGIETMKNQMAMMMTTPQPSTVFPTTVNEEGTIQLVIPDIIGHDTKSKKKLRDQVYTLIPQGYIRGGRPIITDELAKEALKAFKQPKKK